MPKTLHRLPPRIVATATEGWHNDGGGLWLRVREGRTSWIYVWKDTGRRRELALGSGSNLTLAKARLKAQAARDARLDGVDPAIERAALRAAQSAPVKKELTFGEFVDELLPSLIAGFSNIKHRSQWTNTLRTYAADLRPLPIATISTRDVLAVIEPIWLSKNETATRVRERLERVFDAAIAKGVRSANVVNPAQLKGNLKYLLPAASSPRAKHHKALPFEAVPGFVKDLRSRTAPAAKALEWTILTAARTSETLGATWAEVDLTKKTWTVPAGRMKAKREHVVPLSSGALELLERLENTDRKPGSLIFPSKSGAELSTEAMRMLTRRMQRADTTIHGFRSSFSDWAGETTAFEHELVENALAHNVGTAVARAYRRGAAIERRRPLMEAWARYLGYSAARG